jgi:hypothetical protein
MEHARGLFEAVEDLLMRYKRHQRFSKTGIKYVYQTIPD